MHASIYLRMYEIPKYHLGHQYINVGPILDIFRRIFKNFNKISARNLPGWDAPLIMQLSI